MASFRNPAASSLVAALLSTGYPAGSVDPPPEECDKEGIFTCFDDGGGIHTGFSARQVMDLANHYPPGASAERPTSWFEYSAVIACHKNSPSNPKLEICGSAIEYCETYAPDSPGPHSHIYRRVVDEDGAQGLWEVVASTCFTPLVPSRSGVPAEELTMAMIVEAFHRTDFALPETVIQPPDGKTLVNLPVYFELTWPEEGFEPEEVDTTTIAGHQVAIRPVLVGITYVTGDGSSIGPTTDTGGPYPDGGITHTYTSRAEVSPYISVEYGGQVSVDGGEWTTIPATATIDGEATALEVLTSTNRLYSDNG